MTARGQRLTLWLLALILITSLYKGRCSRTETGPAVAFVSSTTAGTTIRVRGDVSRPGIYRLPDGSSLETVTKMTINNSLYFLIAPVDGHTVLKTGTIVDIKLMDSKKYAVSVAYMGVKERIVLGIPLDLGRMEEEDWEALPGIGKKTARDIVEYRQYNGDFPSIEALKNVPGISEVRLQKIQRLFLAR